MMMASMVPFAVVPPGQEAAAAGLAALGLAEGSSNAQPGGFAQVLNTALAPMPSAAKAGAQASFEPVRAATFDLAPSPGMTLDTALIVGATAISAPSRPQFASSAVRSTLLSSASAMPVALDAGTSTLQASLSDSSLGSPPAQPQPVPLAIDLPRAPVMQGQAVESEVDGLLPVIAPNGVTQSSAPNPTASEPQAATDTMKLRQEPTAGSSAPSAAFAPQPSKKLEAEAIAASSGKPAAEASDKGEAGQQSTKALGGAEKSGDTRETTSLAAPAQPQLLGSVPAPLAAPTPNAAATAQALQPEPQPAETVQPEPQLAQSPQPEPEGAQALRAGMMPSNEVSPEVKGSERRARRPGQTELPDTAAAPKIAESADTVVLQPPRLNADASSLAAAASGRASLATKPEELAQTAPTAPPAVPAQAASAVAAPTGNGAPAPEAGLPNFEPAAEPAHGAPSASHQTATASASRDSAMPAPVRASREPTVVARPGQIGRDMGVEIARRVASGGDELVVRLSPQDLGRIEVRMSFDEGGSLRAVMTAESQAALDMLRRDAADLGRALADAGVRADNQSLKFGARDGESGSSSWQRQHQDGGRRDGERHPDQQPADTDEAQYRPLRSAGQIDLMA